MGGYIGATAVGLTTTAADVQGDITSTDTTPELILKNTSEEDTEGGREGKITFKGEQSGGEETTLAQIESAHDGTSDDEKGDLIFKTNDGNDGASPTERLRLDSAGDMLLSSPDPSFTITNTTQEDTDGGRESTIVFKGEQSGGELSTLAEIEASHDGTADDEKGDLIFRTNDGSDGASPTEAMRIDSAQNIAIGTTAPTTFSGFKTLHFKNGSGDAISLVESDGGVISQEISADSTGVTLGSRSNHNVRITTNDTERMRILSHGTFTIGSGTEDAGYGPLQIGSTSTSNTLLQMLAATNGYNTIHMGDATSGAGRYAGYIQYDHGADTMNIGTNGTNRLAIASDGQTSMTGAKASYFMWSVTNSQASSGIGTYRSKTNASGDNTSSYHFVATSSADRMYVYGNGNVVNTNNSYGALSDEKLKENIVDSGSQWDDIKAVRVRKFSMKEDELDAPNKIGVIAQELEASNMGGLVFESPDRDEDGNVLETSTKQVHYSVLYMKAIKALQEAMTRIETLETQNTTQATQIADLITRVEALEGA